MKCAACHKEIEGKIIYIEKDQRAYCTKCVVPVVRPVEYCFSKTGEYVGDEKDLVIVNRQETLQGMLLHDIEKTKEEIKKASIPEWRDALIDRARKTKSSYDALFGGK